VGSLALFFCSIPAYLPDDPNKTHFAPKAKNIIFLFMAGAPSQLDLFDYKPKWRSLTASCPGG
jgi:hypothetical protein